VTNLPQPNRLALPIQPYQIDGYAFKQGIRRRLLLWATHLGDDVAAAVGAPVNAIGDGIVDLAQMHPGSRQKRNWGGLVIIAHTSQHTGQIFYSVYGHLDQLTVKAGDSVSLNQPLGVIAAGNTPANGWWRMPHLHFAICTKHWRGNVPPGWRRPEQWRRTSVRHWQDPREFIEQYNLAGS